MRVEPFSVRLVNPLATAHGEITDREGFVIALDPATDDVDAPGIGEASPLPGWTESRSACESTLREAALCDVTDSSPVRGPSGKSDTLAARHGPDTPAARHGLTLAHADAAARASDRSLARFLAEHHDLPTPSNAVPVNATVGDASTRETVAEAEAAVREGYDCVKVKVGARDLESDVDRLRAVRSAVGDNVGVRADANGGWDHETAERALRAIAPLDLEYVEQPVPADDLDGLAELRRAVPDVPIAVDESLAEFAPERVLDAGAADVLVLKPMVLGGPHATIDAALDAMDRGAEVVVTTTIDAVVARTAALHVAAAISTDLACGLATGDLLADDLAPDPSPVRDGKMKLPDGPGLARAEFGFGGGASGFDGDAFGFSNDAFDDLP